MNENKKSNRGRKKKIVDYNNPFSTRLRQLMDSNIHYTQESVAKSVGVTRQAFGKWITGESIPDSLLLAKLSKYFNVSSDYLIGLSDNKTTDIEIQSICNKTGLSEKSINVIMKLSESDIKIMSKIIEYFGSGCSHILCLINDAINANPESNFSSIYERVNQIEEKYNIPNDVSLLMSELLCENSIVLSGSSYKEFIINQINYESINLLRDVIESLSPYAIIKPRQEACEEFGENLKELEVTDNGKHNTKEE